MPKIIVTTESDLSNLIESTVQRALEKAFSKMPTKASPKINLNIKEVSEYSGYKIGTLYRMVHFGKIPYHKPKHGGSKLIFIKSEIEEWLKGKKPETNEEFCKRMDTKIFKN